MSFPRYESYRDSGVEWLGEVPSHWTLGPLKRSISFTTGWTPPTGRDDLYDGDIPWATIGDMRGRVLSETEKRISATAVTEVGINPSPSGSLLFSFKLSIGQVAFAARDIFTNEAIATFPPNDNIDLGYAYYAFPIFVTANAAENIYGAKLLNQDLIRNALLALPTFAEQSAIAAFLDREITKIDALVDEQRRLIELLKEKRQAVISHAVTKGLDPIAPMKDSGIEWLGVVPSHWEIFTVGRACSLISYGFTNPMPEADEGPYMLTANDIGDGDVDYLNARRTTAAAFDELLTDKSRPASGDVLLTKDGTLGRVAVHNGQRACINQSVAILRSHSEISPEFLAVALSSTPYNPRMIFEAGGTTIKHIYISRLAKMPIALPPKEEMERLVKFCHKERRKFDGLIRQALAADTLLRERRAALISAAVTGKIDVRGAAAAPRASEAA